MRDRVVEPRIRKLSTLRDFPRFVEQRRVTEKVLTVVMEEAQFPGISTRATADLAQASGPAQADKACKRINLSRTGEGIYIAVTVFAESCGAIPP